MVRCPCHPLPLSLAVFTALFAFGASAEEPITPLPFELFHRGESRSNVEAKSAADAGAEASPSAQSESAPSALSDETAPYSAQGQAEQLQLPDADGVKAPFSEPGAVAGLSMDSQIEALEPYKLIRSLQFVQDAVVQGDHSAMEMQRFLIGVIDSRLRQAPQEIFDDPRNVDAALIYAMSGGNPATLDILAIRDKFGNFDNEVTTVLRAYLNGRAATTKTTLGEVVKIYRDTEIGPYITLVAANVMASMNDATALELFDWARLTAPGTLIEEAALRRSLFIAAEKDMVDEALHYAQLYARRFINSPYAGQYADLLVDLVLKNYGKVGDEGLSEILSFMDRPRKREIYLRIARKAAISGYRDLAVFSADKAAALLTATDKSPEAMAELYSGMARIPTDGVGAVLDSINSLPEERLSQRDRALREAAKIVAGEVVRKPVPDSFTQALSSIMIQTDAKQEDESIPTTAGEEKKAGSSIFRRAKSAAELERAAEEEAFKGYVTDRMQALDRIDKLLE